MARLREPARARAQRVVRTVLGVVFGVLVLLFGVGMAGAGAQRIQERHQLDDGHPARATAVVTQAHRRAGSSEQDQIRVAFRTAAGARVETTVGTRVQDDYRDGQRVAVQYLAGDPTVVRLAGHRDSLAEAYRDLAIGGGVLVVLAVTVVSRVLARRRASRDA
jgi:hypothetical protein